jgi:beta-phosphoglucomutase
MNDGDFCTKADKSQLKFRFFQIYRCNQFLILSYLRSRMTDFRFSISIQGLIFDLDGVLVDTRPYHLAAWSRLATQLGVEIDASHNEVLRGLSRMESLEKILEWGNLYCSEAEKLHWSDVKNNWYIDAITRMSPEEVLPGVRSFLETCKSAGKKMAVVSSSKNARTVLQSTELEPLFDAVVDGTMFKKSKPAPDVFWVAAELIGCTPDACVVFEDAPSGVSAAKKEGFYTVGVGIHRALCESNWRVSGFEQLTPIFEEQHSEIE